MADASDSDESFISATVEDEVTIHIKKEIESCGDGLLLRDHCIYKVPITLRHLKPEAYTPKFVSIGPFHHGDERLQDMERHKQTMFKRFTQRATPNLSLDDLVGRIKLLEPEVHASYSETIKLSEDELLKLILMDAGFIIELLVICHKGEEKTDAKLSQPWLDGSIHKDLMLIENQLPFFVIEALFNQALPRDHRGSLPSFCRLVYDYFGDYNRQNIEPNRAVKIKHFTDIIRLFYLPKEMSEKMSDQQPFSEDESHSLLYNANALQEAGIKLKACKSKEQVFIRLEIFREYF